MRRGFPRQFRLSRMKNQCRIWWRMLKRVTSNNQIRQQGSSRWKARLCYAFLILIALTIGLLLFVWNMLCGLPDTNPVVPVMAQEIDVGVGKNVVVRNHSDRKEQNEQSNDENADPHRVEIYYEVLCPDSRYFILKDFIPAYNKLARYIKPVFVPYGKATTNSDRGKLTFDCQHGEAECQGNMIHACAIAHVADEAQLVRYLGCMINNNRKPGDVGKKCAADQDVDWDTIKACWKGTEGPELLKSYGDQTHSLRPPIGFIPTVVIDGSQKGQKDILKDFKSYLCKNTLKEEKPSEC